MITHYNWFCCNVCTLNYCHFHVILSSVLASLQHTVKRFNPNQVLYTSYSIDVVFTLSNSNLSSFFPLNDAYNQKWTLFLLFLRCVSFDSSHFHEMHPNVTFLYVICNTVRWPKGNNHCNRLTIDIFIKRTQSHLSSSCCVWRLLYSLTILLGALPIYRGHFSLNNWRKTVTARL